MLFGTCISKGLKFKNPIPRVIPVITKFWDQITGRKDDPPQSDPPAPSAPGMLTTPAPPIADPQEVATKQVKTQADAYISQLNTLSGEAKNGLPSMISLLKTISQANSKPQGNSTAAKSFDVLSYIADQLVPLTQNSTVEKPTAEGPWTVESLLSSVNKTAWISELTSNRSAARDFSRGLFEDKPGAGDDKLLNCTEKLASWMQSFEIWRPVVNRYLQGVDSKDYPMWIANTLLKMNRWTQSSSGLWSDTVCSESSALSDMKEATIRLLYYFDEVRSKLLKDSEVTFIGLELYFKLYNHKFEEAGFYVSKILHKIAQVEVSGNTKNLNFSACLKNIMTNVLNVLINTDLKGKNLLEIAGQKLKDAIEASKKECLSV